MRPRDLCRIHRAGRSTAGIGALVLAAFAGGCASLSPPPAVPAPEAAAAPWRPPAELAPRPVPLPKTEIPPELTAAAASAGGEMEFSLAQVVDLALRNSSATQETWAAARSAAADMGSRRSAFYPQLGLSAQFERVRQSAVANRFTFLVSDYGPSIALSYLLFDFGGRRADVEEARQALIAADWEHNAAIQAVVLEVEGAYFQYLTAKALRDAQEVSVKEAETNLQAAEDRHRAGVATIADVLQARTLLAQARLDLQRVVGQMKATRGSLATAMGLPPNLPVEVGELPAEVPVAETAAAIDVMLEQAISRRPDLAAARARADAADRKVERVRTQGLPALGLSARVNRTYYDIAGSDPADNYSAQLLFTVPLFTGFKNRNDLAKARADADSAHARAGDLQQRVLVQVWSSYYGLETAAQTVTSSADLLASAQQSEEVAAGRYKAGVGSILDLLTAQATLAGARAQQIQARADWFLALAQLARDTGVLTPRPPATPSQLIDDQEGSHVQP